MDKVTQNEILEFLKANYPNEVYFPEHKQFDSRIQDQDFQAALYYLSEHDLIELKNIRRAVQHPGQVLGAKMLAKGMDYLAPDGGLTEYFNSITVRFDAENIRQTIYAHINALEIDPEKKKSILSRLKDFSVDTLRELAQQAILKSLENPGVLLQLIENLNR